MLFWKKKKKKKSLEKIKYYFDVARDLYDVDKKYANRCVQIARKISQKNQIQIPHSLRRRYCHNCYSYLIPGRNCKIRINEGKLLIKCDECGEYTRMNLHKK